ncbi:MAG: CHAT domain-containing protein [Saprospiraceae bacterium]
MTKLYATVLLIFLVGFSATAQTDRLDSLGLALSAEARVHKQKAEYSLALEKYIKACERFKAEEQWEAFYNFQIGVIDAHFKLGHSEKVLDMVVVEREKIAERFGPDHFLVADYYYLEIKANNRFEDGNRIPELSQKALEILIPTDGNKIGSIYNALGVYWILKKDYDKSLANHQAALDFKLRKFGPTAGTVGVSYNNIGNVYDNLGEYEKAISYYDKSLDVKLKRYGDQHPRVSNTYFNIGTTYVDAGDIKKAITFFEKAIAIDRKSEDDPNRKLAARYTSLSEALLLNNEVELAMEYGILGIEYYSKTSLNPIFPAVAYQNMGNILVAKQDYDNAFVYYQKALALLSSESINEKSLVNPKIEERFATERLFDVLSDKLSTIDKWNKEEPEQFKLEASLQTSEALIRTLNLIQQDIETENSKYLFLSESRWVFEKALGYCYDLFEQTGDPKHKIKALELYEQSKAFLLRNILQDEQAKSIANIPDSIRKEVITRKEELNELAQELSRTLDDTQKKELQSTLFERDRDYQTLVAGLEENFPAYKDLKNEQTAFDASSVQRSIRTDEAVFAWFTGKEHLFFFEISTQHLEFHKLPMSPSFEDDLLAFTALVNDNQLAGSKGNSKAVYQQFCTKAAALYSQLIPAGTQLPSSLILMPDGVLNLIPFEILLTNELVAGSDVDYGLLPYLLKESAIRYAYSPSLLVNQQDSPTGGKDEVLAFAPAYYGATTAAVASRSGMAALQFAQKEIEEISSIFTTENRVGALATKESFTSLASSYRVLHLAMHAFTNDDKPSFSGLAFSQASEDERESTLYAYEIANLSLSADLVVLSACNTGGGKMVEGEGQISLARSFRQAGCPNIVQSLWQADDETTSILMENFYTNLKAGVGKAEALRQAKLSFLKQGRKNFPHYWAAFVLTGDNEELELNNNSGFWWMSGLALLGLFAFVVFKIKS